MPTNVLHGFWIWLVQFLTANKAAVASAVASVVALAVPANLQPLVWVIAGYFGVQHVAAQSAIKHCEARMKRRGL